MLPHLRFHNSLALHPQSLMPPPKLFLSDPAHIARMPEILEVAVILDGATTDYDHGGFLEHEARARLFTFFPLSPLIIHPRFDVPPYRSLS